MSRTILRDVRVLAIDQVTEDTAAESVLGKTATLELTRAQAEIVKAAEATGALSLSLRPFGAIAEEEPTDLVETQRTIRIYRGNDVQTVRMN
jgi:pilus assembly protein CpaB